MNREVRLIRGLPTFGKPRMNHVRTLTTSSHVGSVMILVVMSLSVVIAADMGDSQITNLKRTCGSGNAPSGVGDMIGRSRTSEDFEPY